MEDEQIIDELLKQEDTFNQSDDNKDSINQSKESDKISNDSAKNQEIHANHVVEKSVCFKVEKVFSILLFIVAGLAGVAILSLILMPLFYIMILLLLFCALVVISVFSLGLIYLSPNNPGTAIWGFIEKMSDSTFLEVVMNFCVSAFPYLCICGLGLAVISFILNCVQKKKNVLRFVFVCIVAVLLIIGLVLYFVLGGKI